MKLIRQVNRAWHHAHPYVFGALTGGAVSLYPLFERAYLAPIPAEHLVWVWGLGCLAFILFSLHLRMQLTTLVMTRHGFVVSVRGTPLFRNVVRLHQRAIQWCRWSYLLSFVLGAFYYLFPEDYAFPIWVGVVVCAKLLMNRALNAFNLLQAAYFEDL